MDRSDLRRGLGDATVLLPGVVPFGLIAGIAGVDAGLSFLQTVALSLLVYAGASQLAALELLGADAPLAVVVLTAIIVNLRMVVYSASVAPYVRAFSVRSKALISYLLTDMSYALSVVTFREQESIDRRAYYLGVAVVPWAAWQVATAAGYIVGTGVPASWQLDFTIPLVFLALLAPAIDDRPGLLAAVVGGAVAVAGTVLPFNLGLLAGAVIGVTAGIVATWVGGRRDD